MMRAAHTHAGVGPSLGVGINGYRSENEGAGGAPPSKANLKAWWNQFKFVQRAKGGPGGRDGNPTQGVGQVYGKGEQFIYSF